MSSNHLVLVASRFSERLSLEALLDTRRSLFIDALPARHQHGRFASQFKVDTEVFLLGIVVSPGHEPAQIDAVAHDGQVAETEVRLLSFRGCYERCEWG